MVDKPHYSDFKGRRAAVQYNYAAGRVIKKYREAAGITQIKFGNLIGLSAKSLQNIENGDTNVNAFHLLRTAEVLGITPTTLFRETYKKEV